MRDPDHAVRGGRCRTPTTRRRPATTSSSTARAPGSTRLHPPDRALPAAQGRRGPHRKEIGNVGQTGDAPAATSTSRTGPPPAGTRAAARCRRSATSCTPGTTGPSVRGPAGAIVAAALACACAWPAATPAKPVGAGFELRAGRVKPATAYFDGKRQIKASFTFRADRRLDLVVRVAHAGNGRVVRRWVRHGLAPGKRHRVRWDGRRADRSVPGDGAYEVRVSGRRATAARRSGASSPRPRLPRCRSAHLRRPVRGPAQRGRVLRASTCRRRAARHSSPRAAGACRRPVTATRCTATTCSSTASQPTATTSTPTCRRRTPVGGRAGAHRAADRRRRQDRQRPQRVLPAPLRAMAARLPRRRPVDPAPALREWDAFS